MKIRDHIKYSLLPTIILFYIYKTNALFFFVSTIFIDIDHFIEYVFKTGDFSVKRMFSFYEQIGDELGKSYYLGLSIFHTVEFMLLAAVLSFYADIGKFLLAGILYHNILDFVYLARKGLFFKRSYSIFYYMLISYRRSNQFQRMRTREKEIVSNLIKQGKL